jgi:N6-adenosine-specific RNA methylase IME4
MGYQRGETGSRPKTRFLPYSAMPLDKIRGLPVADLAMPGAYLFLWTPQRYLWDAKLIAETWGWKPLETLVWCKEPRGLGGGGTFAPTVEFVLYCRRPVGALIRAAREAIGWNQNRLDLAIRGRITRISKRWEDDDCYPTIDDWTELTHTLPALADLPLAPNPWARMDTCWWQWKRGPHSAKPPALLDVVERVSPSPYVELFARQPRLGWDSWGRGFENFGDSNRGVEHAL